MDRKPILVIKLPQNIGTQHAIAEAYKHMEERGISDEYHILIVSNGTSEAVDVEVFYDKDIEEKDIQTLREEVMQKFQEV